MSCGTGELALSGRRQICQPQRIEGTLDAETQTLVPALFLNVDGRRGKREGSVEMSTHLILTSIIAIKN